jgi:alkaline phosphatase
MGAGAVGSMLTHSLTSVVTDSAAASSAWATGRKVVNGALSMYPDGRELATILDLAADAGKATGLITTTRLTHATPAAWGARVPDRDLEDDIAAQYLERRPHVLLGGGREHFVPGARSDGRDLVAEFRAAGYQIMHSAAELSNIRGDRLLGVFTEGHLPFEIDRRFQGAAGPSLAAITRAGPRGAGPAARTGSWPRSKRVASTTPTITTTLAPRSGMSWPPTKRSPWFANT